MTQEELQKELEEHQKWLTSNHKDGKQLDLSNANLCGANLFNADLSEAKLSGTNLERTIFRHNKVESLHISPAELEKADINLKLAVKRLFKEELQ